METEKIERIFHLHVRSSNGFKSKDWARKKAGARNHICISHNGCLTSSNRPLLPSYIGRERYGTHISSPAWHVRLPRGSLTAVPKWHPVLCIYNGVISNMYFLGHLPTELWVYNQRGDIMLLFNPQYQESYFAHGQCWICSSVFCYDTCNWI